ncbi:MAG: methionine--tRNA ligase [Candidatus Marinimicrobia bacterium]|nr:methionine--tRNA ligase [Candidatus Neomarinimicrobiota bacterium]
MEQEKFYITTPIYYVNDKPHIGHAYTTILADILARFHREKGSDTFFLTGTDEHGQKVQTSAQERGIAPQEHCDEMVVHFQEAWDRLKINYDKFIRTTDDYHKKIVQQVLQELYDKGEIYADEYGGHYCVGCERFLTDKELEEGNGKCPQHDKEPEFIQEKNYFFKMSKYQDWLIEYINDHPDFIQPEHRKNEVLGFLRQDLNDLCISRPKERLAWGIELPFDSDYVTYVWFDALLNYVTGIGYKQDDKEFEKWWPADFHLIGKDIVTTHCVYWPTMLKAMDVPLPDTIFAHGWWLMNESKMSKSLNNIVSPLDLMDHYGVDPVRYYLVRDMVLGQDANFSEKLFIERYNAELANDFGNLANRITALINKYYDAIPEPGELHEKDAELKENAEKLPASVHSFIEKMDLNKATDKVMEFVRSVNKYMEVREPWKLIKKDKEATGTVLYCAAEALRISARLLHPIMPDKINILLESLPVNQQKDKFAWGGLAAGQKLGDFDALFPRIDVKKVEKKKEKESKPKPKKKKVDMIDIDDFAKVNLKIAQIKEAEPVEGADKLLKLQVDDGEGIRQLVAGIAKHYEIEDLIDQKIVIVANLEPAKIFGVKSEGMLLAASDQDGMALLTPLNDIEAGAEVS